MNIQDIVQQVSKRTNKAADQKLNLRVELFLALDEFCLEQRFWWRRKDAIIQLVADQAEYDLSQADVAPQFAQFDKVYLVDANGVDIHCSLTPLFDPKAQLASILNTTSAVPASYFIRVATSPQTLRLQAPSSVAQKLIAHYWAMPMVDDPDSNTEDLPVPLVPKYLHWVLCYGLERRVYEYLYGQNDPRFTVANARYQEGVIKASRIPEWAVGKVSELRTFDSDLAVQAH